LLINLLHHTVRVIGEIAAFSLKRQKGTAATYKIARNVASIRWVIRTMAMPGSKQLEAAGRTL
jgi:hypothetical protein